LSLTRQQAAAEVALAASFSPARVSFAEAEGIARLVLTPLTATLVHVGTMHVLITMLGLLVCGRVVEAVVGMRGMIILYVAGAYAAAAAHYAFGYFAFGPGVELPLIGAGSAVSAVIGAYAVLLGKNRLRVAGSSRGQWLNALWLATAWIVIQAMLDFAYGVPIVVIPIAALAGGFVAGLTLAKPLLLLRWRGA